MQYLDKAIGLTLGHIFASSLGGELFGPYARLEPDRHCRAVRFAEGHSNKGRIC